MKEKNVSDMAVLKRLSERDAEVDWPFSERMIAARLNIHYQQNLFNEMSIYVLAMPRNSVKWREKLGLREFL